MSDDGPPSRGAMLDRVAVAAIAGIVTGYLVDDLARHFSLVAAIATTLIACGCALRRWTLVACTLGLVCGAATGLADALHLQGPCIDGARTVLSGEVVDLPRARAGLVHFVVALTPGPPLGACASPRPRRIRLAWFTTETVRPHERWAFEVRLRALRNFRDPGAFDYVGWAQAQQIDAAGSVVQGRRLGKVASVAADFDRARIAIGDRFAERGADPHGVLAALVVGDSRRVDRETWDLFRSTGTIHLLVVSGLQVTIFATAGLLLGRALARLLPAALRRRGDAPLGAAAGIVAALVYSALAGWNLPVVRACYMTIAALLWWHSGRRIPAFRAFVLALALLLAADPRAIGDSSLWLSFGAVGVLLAYFDGRRGLPFTSAWLRAQLVLFVAMAPLFALTVGQLARIGPLVNVAAVPFVSVLLTPLALLAVVARYAGTAIEGALLNACASMCDALLRALEACSHAPIAFVDAPSRMLLALSGAAALLVLAPLRLWQRLLLIPVIFAAFHRAHEPVATGAARVLTLDVGQGLSVLVDTSRHRLLYDAGPRYPSGFDLGDVVVVPAVRATGAPSLDLLVVSHGDMDHRGGVDAVERRVTTRAVLSGAAEVRGIACRRGVAWQWDGVTFEVLNPEPAARPGNDASCVLAIRATGGAALLPGDISARAESELVARGAPLGAALLVVPHHGSKTSSTPAFVAAVRPSVAIASAGYRNRFGHPHRDVVLRYAAAHVPLATTIQRGALVWNSDRPGELSSAVTGSRRPLAAPTPGDE